MYVSWIVALDSCDQYWTDFIGLTGKCLHGKCFLNLKCCLCEHDISSAFGKIVMAEESKHVESCSSTTKNLISLLPESLLVKTSQSKNISTTTISLVNKLGRMVTYLDGLLPIKSHDPLITWFFETMWQIKNITSPLP